MGEVREIAKVNLLKPIDTDEALSVTRIRIRSTVHVLHVINL